MKLRTKRNGIAVLCCSVILGFVFPSYAKWILLALAAMGIVSWMRQRREELDEEERIDRGLKVCLIGICVFGGIAVVLKLLLAIALIIEGGS